MLNLEALESRDCPSRVWVGVGIIERDPVRGTPEQIIRLIQGDNPHSPEVVKVLPGKGTGEYDVIGVNS